MPTPAKGSISRSIENEPAADKEKCMDCKWDNGRNRSIEAQIQHFDHGSQELHQLYRRPLVFDDDDWGMFSSNATDIRLSSRAPLGDNCSMKMHRDENAHDDSLHRASRAPHKENSTNEVPASFTPHPPSSIPNDSHICQMLRRCGSCRCVFPRPTNRTPNFLYDVFALFTQRSSFIRFLLLLIFVLLERQHSYALLVNHQSGGFRGVPGRFCADLPRSNGLQGQCCTSRNDSCGVPIGGTMCYCDIFCDRRPGAHPAEHKDPSGLSYYDFGDCCPDFWCHCRGEQDQCVNGPQSPFITVTPAVQQAVTTMFMLSAQSPAATSAPPRRARVSQEQQDFAHSGRRTPHVDDIYYFDHTIQQQQPSSADNQHQNQFSSQHNFNDDADDEACCHYYHDDDAGDSRYLPNPIVIPQGETIRINCNTCTCRRQVRRSGSSSSDSNGRSGPYLPDVECTKHICLMDPQFATHLNEHWTSFGWQAATNYSHYWGKTLQWGLKHRLGTHSPSNDAFNMMPMRVHGAQIETVPKEFDARERWRTRRGETLSEIVDQGSCGGSWAFSTVQVAQDRLNVIFTNRKRRNMRASAASPSLLSVQQLLACDRRRNQLGCDGGGHVDRAWYYMRTKGVVGESCYPTRADWWWNDNSEQQRMTPRCELDKLQQSGNHAVQCPNASRAQSSSSPISLRYKMSPAYRIAPVEAEIQTEIMRSGPVQAIIRVRPDFFMYKDGVYKHTEQLAQSLAAEKYHAYYHHRDLEEYYQPHHPPPNTDNSTMSAPSLPPPLPEPLEAHHAVRIIGWGVDYTSGRPLKYWECANTWGTWWGRDGYFRILRGETPESESDVELFIIGVWPRRPVRADRPNKRRTNNNNNSDVENANDRQFRSRRQQQLSSRKRERRRLKKTLQHQRRLERYFKLNSDKSKRHKRLQKRKLMLGLKPLYNNKYDYLEDDNNSQLARLKRLSRAVKSAAKSRGDIF